jgi:hypothetical protein
MRVQKHLQVRPKIRGNLIDITFTASRQRVVIDRKRYNRPVWQIVDFKGKLPFRINLGGGLVVQPRFVLKVYYPSKSQLARHRAHRTEVQSP